MECNVNNFVFVKKNTTTLMTEIPWKPFTGPSCNFMEECSYLVLLEDRGYEWEKNPEIKYYTDIAVPYGDYIDNFWDTENDWIEGQEVHVLAYCDVDDIVINKLVHEEGTKNGM